MPPVPFPYALRVGTDLCNVARLRSIITRAHSGNGRPPLQQFLCRILTHPERHYFRKRFGGIHDASADLDAMAQFLAGRFAAKEACRKACDHLGRYTRGFKHIIVLPVTTFDRKEHQSARPQGLILHNALQDPQGPGEAKDSESTEKAEGFNVNALEGQLCEISISHDGDFATAVALVPSMRKDPARVDTVEAVAQL